jgi:hypothetical protein
MRIMPDAVNPVPRSTIIVIDRGTPGQFETTLGQFLDDNSAPGVEPLSDEEVDELVAALAADVACPIGWFMVERA